MNENVQPLISVIIPVYNVEKYIGRCLDSIIWQTYKNWEVIAVDDGSQDGSGAILDRYGKNDCRIRPIHVSNSGVSNARNIGIDHARGDYISFIDSDDWVKSEMFEILLNYAVNYKCDFVQTEFAQVGDENELFRHECKEPGFVEGNENIIKLYSKEIVHNSICTKLFKRDLVNGLRLDTNLHVGEDAQFTFKVCKRASAVFLYEEALYQYYQRRESAVHTKRNRKLFDILDVLNLQMLETKQWPDIYSNLRLRRDKNIIRLFQIAIEAEEAKDVLYSLQKQLRDELNFYSAQDVSRLEKAKAYIICYFPFILRLYMRVHSLKSKGDLSG